MIAAAIALVLAAVIVMRCICVLYMTTNKKHRHPLLFLGFGYSYVTLGAGALAGSIALVTDHKDLHDLAVWLLLVGSCGLIVFDRRAALCWSRPTCPLEKRE